MEQQPSRFGTAATVYGFEDLSPDSVRVDNVEISPGYWRGIESSQTIVFDSQRFEHTVNAFPCFDNYVFGRPRLEKWPIDITLTVTRVSKVKGIVVALGEELGFDGLLLIKVLDLYDLCAHSDGLHVFFKLSPQVVWWNRNVIELTMNFVSVEWNLVFAYLSLAPFILIEKVKCPMVLADNSFRMVTLEFFSFWLNTDAVELRLPVCTCTDMLSCKCLLVLGHDPDFPHTWPSELRLDMVRFSKIHSYDNSPSPASKQSMFKVSTGPEPIVYFWNPSKDMDRLKSCLVYLEKYGTYHTLTERERNARAGLPSRALEHNPPTKN